MAFAAFLFPVSVAGKRRRLEAGTAAENMLSPRLFLMGLLQNGRFCNSPFSFSSLWLFGETLGEHLFPAVETPNN